MPAAGETPGASDTKACPFHRTAAGEAQVALNIAWLRKAKGLMNLHIRTTVTNSYSHGRVPRRVNGSIAIPRNNNLVAADRDAT